MIKDTLKTNKTDKELWATICKKISAKKKVLDRFTIAGLNTLGYMSQIVERTQADYIKSVEKQTTSSVQEEQLDDTTTQEVAGTSTEKVADTTAQELDDESHASTYLHEAHRLAYVRLNGDTLKSQELASLD